MDGSLPNLRGHLVGFLEGVIEIEEFYRWSWDNSGAIEEHGSDNDVELLNLVLHRFAEYTGGYIDAANLLDALRTDPLVQQVLSTHRTAVA
ncbi:MAG: hypothetical protein ACRDJC_15145 [Thermomicrobiales bacterium]